MADLTLRNPGFGLGLRPTNYPDFLDQRQGLDWLEIISDNFLVSGGKPLALLDRLRAEYPMAMHGVAMSLASVDGPDHDYLLRLKALAQRIEPAWISDHLCWTGWRSNRLHDLNPMPYTEESARRVIGSISRVQDVLGCRLVVENVSSYVEFADNACSEWQFLSHVANEADCLLLLDVNNVYVSSVNHGFDPMAYLRAMPAHRIQQIHLAGHVRHPHVIIDTHDHPVCAEVWELYAQACALWGPVATMIERDDHIPPLADLLAELQIARDLCKAHAPKEEKRPAGVITPMIFSNRTPSDPSWPNQIQQEWVQAILTEPQDTAAPILRRFKAGHHFDVYRQAYPSRLSEALAQAYPKTLLYMGSEVFDVNARSHALARPPEVMSLNDYGESFAMHLAQTYPDHPELAELATLEWHLHAVYAAANAMPLRQSDLAQDATLSWLQHPWPMQGHARLMTVTRSVPQIWNAIHRDEDVPPVKELAQATDLLIWRKGEQPHFVSLGALEAVLIRHMCAGHSIADACEWTDEALALEEPEFLPTCLSRWLSLELLVAPTRHPKAV